MLPLSDLDPTCAYLALENPRWVGSDDDADRGRVYGVDVVQYDDSDAEIKRDYFACPPDPYYPQLSVLQGIVAKVNEGGIARR